MTKLVKVIPEVKTKKGGRLGRHIEHDPASKDFAFGITTAPGNLVKVSHRRFVRIFDQGDLGSCTGNACAGAIDTAPFHQARRNLHEQDAVDLYELATQIDDIPGTYPPDDTGSSGLAVAKAAQQKGYITAYNHAFSVEEALAALQKKPVITGVNWYEGFDTPDANGLVSIAGQVRGGHEFVVIAFEPAASLDDSVVEADNSWGPTWGKNGKFRFTVATWRQLLAEQGDVTILN